ncbi:alginate O-acetyltransferase AlgX-related protein [Ruegeria faecimaris]|uniref:alginate O-acetyltransferase AlgX-related protein n=1 Tax=Ruegeria faecimaris TaxID=686389 RepID=UPI0024912D58|nr:GDSL-type esterase/lipase family protein [Ruegeria faecimaris]
MTEKTRSSRFGSILCLVAALYFFAVVAYALMNSAEFANGTARLIRYILAPGAIGLVLALCAVFLSDEGRLTVGVSAVSLLAALFAFEAYLTIKIIPGRLGLVGFVGDDVSVEEYKENLPPGRTMKHVNDELDTQLLESAYLAPMPGDKMLLCSVLGEPVTYTPDRLGFRNPPSVFENDVNVMLLGDSFSEGFCLREGEHLADKLRQDIPSLLNTGHRGIGPLYQLAVLGRYGPEFQPDLTIFSFFAGNDWRNLERELEKPWLREALDPAVDFGPIEHPDQSELTAPVISVWWAETTLSWGDYLRAQRVFRNFLALQKTAEILGIHYPKATDENPVFADVLIRAKQITSQWDGEIVIVYVPTVSRYMGLVAQPFIHDPLRVLVKDAAAQAGLDVIDLTDVIEMQEDPASYYAPDSHFNKAGAELAARAITEGLRQRNLIEQ